MDQFLLRRSLRRQFVSISPARFYTEIPISSLDPGIPSLKEHILIGFVPSTDLFLTIPTWPNCGLSIWRYGEPATLVRSIDTPLSNVVKVQTACSECHVYQLVSTKDFLEFRKFGLNSGVSFGGMSVSSPGMICWKYLSSSNMMVTLIDDIAACYPIRRQTRKWEEADDNGLLRINLDLYLEIYMTRKLQTTFRVLNFRSLVVDSEDDKNRLKVFAWAVQGLERLVWVLLLNLYTGEIQVTSVKKYRSAFQVDPILLRLGLQRHICSTKCLGKSTKVLETYEFGKRKGVEKIVWDDGARVITGWVL
ncbi:hypothetical protein NEOLI_001683 [Neolecta irregularis DAH-3]|uniref:Uncharacterized protein n=1 Tax=Neolecta irregularis (strain DAH-3) TaxID=1198029 RepID=A0A1U7LRG3_NEOID|nr:hypothetical protein NEOLI_001683 [Neolecta irregularis DAH-3]|eukprot:OLL25234.1 hypothetical protein NEOLI_001683 [Neolecta irregularis DAH-3]